MMKKSLIISAIIVLSLAGCAKQIYDRSQSPDEMARQLLSQIPDVPERRVEPVSTPPVERPSLPFEVYTWQPRDRADGARDIVVLGKNLTEAKLLTIGDLTIELTPREDGRSAVGSLSFRLAEGSADRDDGGRASGGIARKILTFETERVASNP